MLKLYYLAMVLGQERPFQRFQDSGNDFLGALRAPWWPIAVIVIIMTTVIMSKSAAKVVMVVVALGIASVFIYNPDTLQSIGHIFVA